MKKSIPLQLLAIGILLGCWLASQPLPLAAQAQQASPWKNRAEYDAFNAIAQTKDPTQKAQLADKFLTDYPDTKVAAQVLTMKLQAYQQLNDTAKMQETADKIVQANPTDLYALFVLSTLFPQTFTNPDDPAAAQKLDAASDHAKKGLEQVAALQKPAALSDDDFKKQKGQLESSFHSALGFVALQKKDYPGAQEELHKAVEINPNDAVDYYRLGLAYLTPKPDTKFDEGMWALARAISITGPGALPPDSQTQVKDYLGKVYEARHGTAGKMDVDLLAKAAAAPFPPDGFHIQTAEEAAPPSAPEPEPAPAPAAKELSVKPEDLGTFDDIQKYLSGAAGAEKQGDAWTLLKGAQLPLPGKVISATPAAKPKVIVVAVSPALANQAERGDVELTLANPLAKPLEKGATIQFEGTVDSYRAKPFELKLVDGKVTP